MLPDTSPKASMQVALERHVRVLAEEIGERNVFRPAALATAAEYIASCWRMQGYEVVAQAYGVRGVRCANLEATRPGTTRADQILLIGAHYDSVMGSPGANDNASGVAALLEISGLFARCRPAMTVRFVAFVNEETPFFMTRRQGSAVYAKAARARGDDIRLMLSLEMLGCFSDAIGSQGYPPLFRWFYPECGNFLAFISNFRSRALVRQLAGKFRRHSDLPLEYAWLPSVIPGVSWSDHRSFWKRGYAAFMVTDTAFYRYPYYHTADDTPDKLSYSLFARATDGLCLTLADIATTGLDGAEGRPNSPAASSGLPR
jgi:Zn-dependent M28 family amino/carboxypeptidase